MFFYQFLPPETLSPTSLEPPKTEALSKPEVFSLKLHPLSYVWAYFA